MVRINLRVRDRVRVNVRVRVKFKSRTKEKSLILEKNVFLLEYRKCSFLRQVSGLFFFFNILSLNRFLNYS